MTIPVAQPLIMEGISGECERILKEFVVDLFKVLSLQFPRDTE
jgi:hypothetical protein